MIPQARSGAQQLQERSEPGGSARGTRCGVSVRASAPPKGAPSTCSFRKQEEPAGESGVGVGGVGQAVEGRMS